MAVVMRAESRAVAALERTSEVLYATDMALAYQSYDSGWSDEVRSILDRNRTIAGQADRPGLEWRLLEALTQPPASTVLAGHHGQANDLAVFPDRRRLASVGDDGTLRIWDVVQGRLIKTVRLCDKPLYSVAVSPDGRYIVAGELAVYLYDVASDALTTVLFSAARNVESLAFSGDGTRIFAGVRYHEVCLLDLDGQIVRRIPCDSRVESLQWLPDNSGVLIPARHTQESSKQEQVVEIWDTELEHIQQVLHAPSDEPSRFTAARISPCGNDILAAERYLNRARLLRRDSGEMVAETPVFRDRVNDVAYSPDGRAIAVAYQNGISECFRLSLDASGTPSGVKRLHIVNSHEGEALCLRFVKSNVVATSGADGLIRLWSFTEAGANGLQVEDEPIVGIELSPDGELLLYTLHDEFVVLHVASGKSVARSTLPSSHYCAPAWSPSGDRAAFICRNRSKLVIINRAGQVVATMSVGEECYDADFSPDGSCVAAIGQDRLEAFEVDTGYRVLDHSLLGIGNRGQIAFANKSNLVACGGEPGEVVVFNLEARRVVLRARTGSGVNCVAFSPDDEILATGHNDSIIRLWNATDGDRLAELAGHSQTVFSLAFSPDSRTLLSSSLDGSVRIWSVDQRRAYGVVVKRPHVRTLSGFPGCYLTLSADGRRLALAYRSRTEEQSAVLFWDLSQTASAR